MVKWSVRWICNPEFPGSNPAPPLRGFVFGGGSKNSSTLCK